MSERKRADRPVTVAGLILALFMGALESTVVSTAMPTVVGDLGGISHYSWVFTAYLLASTVTVPVYGKLSDIYGRKPVILGGIALFLAASMASGLADSMPELIVWRAVQGLGAGAMQATALTVIGDIFDLEERARMQGLFGAVWGLAGLLGPMVGGLVVKHLSWHWIFFMNVPVGLVSAALLITALHENIEKRRRPIDVAGGILLTVSVLLLLFGARADRLALLLLPLAALGLMAFLRIEARASDPVLPLSLFQTRVMWVSSLAGALVGAAMFAMMTYVPLYVQGVLGGSPTQAGSAITPMVIAWPLASALGGRLIPRIGFRPLVRTGLCIAALSAFGLALFIEPRHGLWVARAASAGFGVGMGLANTALLIAVQTSVAWEQRGVATASTMFFRSIGGTLAIGVTGAILTAALFRDHIPGAAADLIVDPVRRLGLPAGLLMRISHALQSGLGSIFWIVFALAAVAFAVSLLFPTIPMQQPKRT